VGRKLLLAGQEIANNNESFHSISFPNEWGDCLQLKPETIFTLSMSFHSISFPNEWGGNYFSRSCPCYVSIQLVSPTSGETSRLDFLAQQRLHKLVSIQLVSPTSGECGRLSWINVSRKIFGQVSIQLVSPTSGEPSTPYLCSHCCCRWSFHSISFPNEWGVCILIT